MVIDEHITMDGTRLLMFSNYCLEPKYATRDFYHHNELEISLVKSGSGEYFVDGKIYDIREGDVFLFNNIETHTICSIEPGKEFINMVLMFDPRFVWSTESNIFDSRFLDIFFKRNEQFQNRLDNDNEAIKDIRRLMLEIEEEFCRKAPEYQLMIKVKLLSILAVLIRCFDYTRCEDITNIAKKRQDLLLVNKITNFINTNLASDIRLEDLADLVHMNPSYLSTFFKKHMGMSPLQYLAKKRINRAMEYLKNSNKTILEIAGLCGFNSTASFNKAFKKIVGKVPSEFR